MVSTKRKRKKKLFIFEILSETIAGLYRVNFIKFFSVLQIFDCRKDMLSGDLVLRLRSGNIILYSWYILYLKRYSIFSVYIVTD